jgi:hypothetical protein
MKISSYFVFVIVVFLCHPRIIIGEERATAYGKTIISQTLPLGKRQDVFLTYYVAYTAANISIQRSASYKPRDSKAYAVSTVVKAYEVQPKTLQLIFDEGRRKRWMEFIHPLNLSLVLYKADEKKRLPTVNEIKILIGSENKKSIRELASDLKKYPGSTFNEATTILARRSEHFDKKDISYVLDAYIDLLLDASGFEYHSGYYHDAHERLELSFRNHRATVQELLDKHLPSAQGKRLQVLSFLKDFYSN